MTVGDVTGGALDLADLDAAAALLAGIIQPTPLELSRTLSDSVGGPVYLKCENLQRTGSFKIRGAYVRLARLTATERDRGVVAASAGNHAQGVALAARLLKTHATVFMPARAALPKIQATRAYGADVQLVGATVDEAMVAAIAFAAASGATFIHPFDHHDVIAGQATVGVEISRQCPDLKTVLCPVGGGGLLAGVSIAVKRAVANATVLGVQAGGAPAVRTSLLHGRPVTVQPATLADGIAVATPGKITLPIIAAYSGGILTVSETEIADAVVFAFQRAKLTVEPAGAVGIAAALHQPQRLRTPAVIVVSGGNIDPILMVKFLRHDLAGTHRYLSVCFDVPDQVGVLANILSDLARLDVNVLDITQGRLDPHLPFGTTRLTLHLEARGADHVTEILGALRGAGGWEQLSDGSEGQPAEPLPLTGTR
ncbi:MAG TPA: threonine ammonia-lyase [Mycobacteriales bacterium]|nr:threonine ammonia-lyase [Mycobacteriales bacterium]